MVAAWSMSSSASLLEDVLALKPKTWSAAMIWKPLTFSTADTSSAFEGQKMLLQREWI
jgi:hypothetical protein